MTDDYKRSLDAGAELAAAHGPDDPFAAAIKATRMAMIVTDARQADHPIIFVNDAFLALTGYARDELEEVGCRDVGHAMSSDEAIALASLLQPDLALVDVHLRDGPTGVEVARRIASDCGGVALFMTANVKRLPEDFAGACGVIGKPYSEHGVKTALNYLKFCLREGHAPGLPPAGFQLAPQWAERWGLGEQPQSA